MPLHAITIQLPHFVEGHRGSVRSNSDRELAGGGLASFLFSGVLLLLLHSFVADASICLAEHSACTRWPFCLRSSLFRTEWFTMCQLLLLACSSHHLSRPRESFTSDLEVLRVHGRSFTPIPRAQAVVGAKPAALGPGPLRADPTEARW